jgi:acyl-CoA thioesterase
MADLSSDTEISGGDGVWWATVSGDWALWGPNGGYLATIALRAAGRHMGGGLRPASLECHFLRSPRPGGAQLTTRTLTRTRRAHSTQVTMTQEGRPILEALVWAVEPGLEGLPPRTMPPPPDASAPGALASMEDLFPAERLGQEPFWKHVEERPVYPAEHETWPEVASPEPVRLSWLRFRPEATFADSYLDAARAVILIDVYPFLAGLIVLSAAEFTHVAPTLSLSVSFHGLRPQSPWLLMRAESPYMGDGLLGGSSRIWSQDGHLLADGRSQMLCRAITG